MVMGGFWERVPAAPAPSVIDKFQRGVGRRCRLKCCCDARAPSEVGYRDALMWGPRSVRDHLLWPLAIIVSFVTFMLFALQRIGLALNGFDYESEEFARMQLLDALTWTTVVASDLTVIISAQVVAWPQTPGTAHLDAGPPPRIWGKGSGRPRAGRARWPRVVAVRCHSGAKQFQTAERRLSGCEHRVPRSHHTWPGATRHVAPV